MPIRRCRLIAFNHGLLFVLPATVLLESHEKWDSVQEIYKLIPAFPFRLNHPKIVYPLLCLWPRSSTYFVLWEYCALIWYFLSKNVVCSLIPWKHRLSFCRQFKYTNKPYFYNQMTGYTPKRDGVKNNPLRGWGRPTWTWVGHAPSPWLCHTRSRRGPCLGPNRRVQ